MYRLHYTPWPFLVPYYHQKVCANATFHLHNILLSCPASHYPNTAWTKLSLLKCHTVLPTRSSYLLCNLSLFRCDLYCQKTSTWNPRDRPSYCRLLSAHQTCCKSSRILLVDPLTKTLHSIHSHSGDKTSCIPVD